jgi:hypothetical protein
MAGLGAKQTSRACASNFRSWREPDETQPRLLTDAVEEVGLDLDGSADP